MSSISILTDLALAKIVTAAGTASAVEITHVAVGDGGGAAYNPTHDQVALVNETYRVAIDWRVETDPNTWWVQATFPATGALEFVREIGFFDADGDLISIEAGLAFEARPIGVIAYVPQFYLNFDRATADGAVTITAPDNDLYEHAVANLQTQALDASAQLDTHLYHRDAEEALAARDAAAAQMAPVGMVAPFARLGTPAGWIECDGRALSRASYGALFAAIGITFGAGDGATTFNVPDLRGEFVRGWDHGRGIDPSRRFGSAQADELKAHTHGLQEVLYNATNWTGGDGFGIDTAPDDTTQQAGQFYDTEATGGTETRPRNVALKYCIRF